MREALSLVQVAIPSRDSDRQYRDSRKNVERIVGRIDGRFGTPMTTPTPSTARRTAVPYAESAFVHGSADRNAVLRAAFANNAPLHVVRTLFELPKQYYVNLDELAQELDRVAD